MSCVGHYEGCEQAFEDDLWTEESSRPEPNPLVIRQHPAMANQSDDRSDGSLADEHGPDPFVDLVAELRVRLGYRLDP